MAVIPYSDVIDRQLLPVDAQDIVTKVRLVIAGDMAGQAPTTFVTDSGAAGQSDRDRVDYVPLPLTFEYEAPEHATYGAEKSFALPSGMNPFLPPTDERIPEPRFTNFDNPGDPSAVRDGDPATFAEYTGGVASIDYPSAQGAGIVGYRLRYDLVTSSTTTTYVQAAITPVVMNPLFDDLPSFVPMATGAIVAALVNPLPPSEAPTEQYMVLPPTAHWSADNSAVTPIVGRGFGKMTLFASLNVTSMRVYAFYPLILNEDLLEDIARAQVRLPALLPQRVTVRGYVSPDREHTITGWPGGDYTGVVAQHQYDLGRTVIDFEQAGSPVGLPAEAIEAARERRQAIEGTVQVANYNLMMGSRR